MENQGISVNQLYPVIEYEENVQTGAKKYRIYDDCRSISWRNIDNFDIESSLLDNYIKKDKEGVNTYIYKGIDEQFLYKLYLENDESKVAVSELEDNLIDIISGELSVKNISNNIFELGLKNETTEMQLRAFFRKAGNQEVNNLAIELYNRVQDINPYILTMIVDNLKSYKEPDVENLFIEIYMNISCDKHILNIVDSYLN